MRISDWSSDVCSSDLQLTESSAGALWYWVATVSVYTSRTAPVCASATRKVADLCPRSVLTKARVLPSGPHCTSSQPSLHARSSAQVERCWSGGDRKRVV